MQVQTINPLQSILSLTLTAMSDGQAGAEQEGTVADLFLSHPTQMLRAASRTKNGMSLLAEFLERGGGDWSKYSEGKAKTGDYTRVRSILHKMRRSSDRKVASAARQCQKEFDKAIGGY